MTAGSKGKTTCRDRIPEDQCLMEENELKKVVVGMSGGVDSAVAAYLLKEAGYEVIGVTLRTWQAEDGSQGRCCDIDDARNVANKLGIKYVPVNCTTEFKNNVIDPFTNEYLCGRTPNPCVVCNRTVKWERLLYYAKVVGADHVATGHYASIVKLDNGRYTVKQAAHSEKDQAYMLYRLSQEQLAATLLPLGSLSKSEVRKIAEDAKLPVASKPDSQEVCFVTDGNYADYIEKTAAAASAKTANAYADYIEKTVAASKIRNTNEGMNAENVNERNVNVEDMSAEDAAGGMDLTGSVSEKNNLTKIIIPGEGMFVDEAGNVLGKHKGIYHYTVGQRKGLGIALGRPAFVKEIRVGTNEVVLSDEQSLYHKEVYCTDLNFMSIPVLKKGETVSCKVKIRYQHKGQPAVIEMADSDTLRILFDDPVRAATPGQSAVFYDDEGFVIGGGIISGTN